MTWRTLGEAYLGPRLKKLSEEIRERNAEHKEHETKRPPVTPTDIWLDEDGNQRVRAAAKHDITEPPYISPVMRPIIDKIRREINES